MTTLTKGEKEFFNSLGVDESRVTESSESPFILGVYTIYDLCTDTFDAPFIRENDKSSIRTISDTVMLQDNMIRRHPEDYQLFCIGKFDKKTGLIQSLERPRKVVNFKDLVSNKKPEG